MQELPTSFQRSGCWLWTVLHSFTAEKECFGLCCTGFQAKMHRKCSYRPSAVGFQRIGGGLVAWVSPLTVLLCDEAWK
jgi:hypothetical protein